MTLLRCAAARHADSSTEVPPPQAGRHLTLSWCYRWLNRGRRTDDRLELFAVGVLAVVTTTNRLPNAFGRRRITNATWPFLFVLLACIRPMTDLERALRTVTFAPRTKRPRRSLIVTIIRSRFVALIRFV